MTDVTMSELRAILDSRCEPAEKCQIINSANRGAFEKLTREERKVIRRVAKKPIERIVGLGWISALDLFAVVAEHINTPTGEGIAGADDLPSPQD